MVWLAQLDVTFYEILSVLFQFAIALVGLAIWYEAYVRNPDLHDSSFST